MTLKEHFAKAAIQGSASTALESDFLAQRAWDIAEAMVRNMPKDQPETALTTPEAAEDHCNGNPVVQEKPDPAVKTKNGWDEDTSKPRLSRNGKYMIPADNDVYMILKDIGPANCGKVVYEYNCRNKIPTAQHSVLSVLERLVGHAKIYVNRKVKPFMWSTEELPLSRAFTENGLKNMDVKFYELPPGRLKVDKRNGKPKDLYDSKLLFAKKLGFENVAQAIASVGKTEFQQKFNDQ